MEQVCQKHVQCAHLGVEQPQPGHGPHIGGNHIGHDEQGTEEVLAVQICPAHQPGQGEGQQHTEDHGQTGRNNGVFQARPVQGVCIDALKALQRELPIHKEGADQQIEEGEDLENEQKAHDGKNEDPLDIKIMFFLGHGSTSKFRHWEFHPIEKEAGGTRPLLS